MIRFTETQKWDDPWFRSLPGAYKLVFLYIIDRCNNAGFWEVDMDALAFHTKLEPRHYEGALKGLERGIEGASGWVWVKNFLRHQKNERLNPANPAHRQIISLLEEQSQRFPNSQSLILEGASKGLPSPIGTGKGKSTGTESAENPKEPTGTVKPKARGTIEEFKEFFVTLSLPESDAEYAFHKWEGNGWMNGKNPIKDWKATVRQWKTGKFFPSQKEEDPEKSCKITRRYN